MDKMIWYNKQHVAAEDLTQIYLDLEAAYIQHIKDFHTSKNNFVLGSTAYGPSSLKPTSTAYASLTVEISGGVAYYNSERIENPSVYSYVMGAIPANQGGGLNITRIDLLYVKKVINSSLAIALDFIDSNRNIYQETKNTRNLDSFEFGVVRGLYNVGGAIPPVIPNTVVPLAYVYLRDATNKIYNYNTNSLNEGYIVDIRNIINSQTI